MIKATSPLNVCIKVYRISESNGTLPWSRSAGLLVSGKHGSVRRPLNDGARHGAKGRSDVDCLRILMK